MTDAESYDLIAYDIDTQKEVLHWRNVTLKSGAFYTAGSTIVDDNKSWFVVGIRKTSTAGLKEIDVRRARKFNLRDYVRKTADKEVRTVEEIRDGAGTEPSYSIQLGSDFTSRKWAKENEIERVLCSEVGCKRPADELRQMLEPDRTEIPWPLCEEHAKGFDALAEAALGPDPSSE
ncbi:MAG: hypothetical protein WBW53_13615 [Terriglobales bacterium]